MITVGDVLPNDVFLARRARLERNLVAAKAVRRVALGPSMTLLFENRTTVLWQIQEMCRVEGITRRDAIQHEVDTYAALLPGPDELSATLLIEVQDPAARAELLRRLAGLDRHLRLRVGSQTALARFDTAQYETDRVSSVQFVRFPLGGAPLRDLSQPATLSVDHPAYAAVATLSPTTRGALVEDLAEQEGATTP